MDAGIWRVYEVICGGGSECVDSEVLGIVVECKWSEGEEVIVWGVVWSIGILNGSQESRLGEEGVVILVSCS